MRGTRERGHHGLSASARRKAGEHIGDHYGTRAAPHLNAWAIMPAAWAATFVLWLVLKLAHQQGIYQPLVAAASAGLTWMTHRINHETGRWGRRHQTLTTGAALTWLTYTIGTPFGPLGPDTVPPAVLLWFVGGLSWSMRVQQRAGNGGGHTIITASAVEKIPRKFTREAWDKLKLAGAHWRVAVDPDKETASGPVQLVPGQQTTADLEAARPQIASLARVSTNRVRVVKSDDDEAAPTLTIIAKNMLTGDNPWPGGADRADLAVTEPILVGVYEDAETVRIPVFTATGATHYLVMGMTGSGKSVFLQVVILDLLARTAGTTDDVIVWLSDTIKYWQIPEPVRRCFDWGASTVGETKSMVKAVKHAISERARYLGERGLAEWQPGCGLSPMIVYFEEASGVGTLNALKTLTNAARSVGISLWFSLQLAKHDQMDTTVREGLSNRLCFGVQTDAAAVFCLSDETLDAGAEPHVWKRKHPGRFYLETDTTELDRQVTPAWTYLPSKADLESTVGRYLPYRHALDEFTAAAVDASPGGLAYRNRGQRQEPALAAAHSPAGLNGHATTPAGAMNGAVNGSSNGTANGHRPEGTVDLISPKTLEDQLDDDLDDLDDDLDTDEELPDDPDPDLNPDDADLDDDVGSVPMGPPPEDPRVTPEEADALFVGQLRAWMLNGKDVFCALEMYPVQAAAGRSRPWIYKRIEAHIERGTLTELPAAPGERASAWRITGRNL